MITLIGIIVLPYIKQWGIKNTHFTQRVSSVKASLNSSVCFVFVWCFVGVAVSVVYVSVTTWISGRDLHCLCPPESLPARPFPLRQTRSQGCLEDGALFLR